MDTAGQVSAMLGLNEVSAKRLSEVHKDLSRVIVRSHELYKSATGNDFVVTEGLRDREKQRQLFLSGKSRTMKSRHLTGHAVDLAVIVDGRAEWALHMYTTLAEYVAGAARILNIPVVWGGCWVSLNSANDLDAELMEYIKRVRKEGRKPFIDGPHFELDSDFYP